MSLLTGEQWNLMSLLTDEQANLMSLLTGEQSNLMSLLTDEQANFMSLLTGEQWNLISLLTRFLTNNHFISTENSEIIAMFLLLQKLHQGYNRNNLNLHFEIFYMT